MDEEEVWVILHGKPKEIDSDLASDVSMLGQYRMEQITRWRQTPGYFLSRDINAMLAVDVVAHRRKLLLKRMMDEFKEGTNVRRDDEGTTQD